MQPHITLTDGSKSDLDWIMTLETEVRVDGFLRGDDIAGHEARLADPHTQYKIIHANDEKAGFVILAGVGAIDRNIEIGRIIIAAPGKGAGQAAMKEIIRYVFEDLDANRIWLDTLPHNTRAQHVYEKLGFVQEGRARQVMYLGGKFHDLLQYGLLAEEWRQRA